MRRGEDGPTVSLRGIDNRSYYRLKAADLAVYEDFTGCGNTLNVAHPQTLKLIMDSLRYWVTEMHVDGFRFDLAPTLARDAHAVDRLSSFFDIIHQDPVLSEVKLIAEPWDLGVGGYQVGNFPVLWSEWNGRYRDTTRAFWTNDRGARADFASRLAGSSDLFGDDGRAPTASINFITAHDGFTLRDLVTYERKHNEANGEQNTDGAGENHAWNGGTEGETSDASIRALRAQQMRNLLATLFLSQGVPMLLAGDELSRTQGGNNNAYCQDNDTSYIDWTDSDDKRAFLEFTRTLARIRAAHPALRRTRFLRGQSPYGSVEKDVTWLRPEGGERGGGVRERGEMGPLDWQKPDRAALGMLLAGDAVDGVDVEGGAICDETLLALFNASSESVLFSLPPGEPWQLVVDTTVAEGAAESTHQGALSVGAHSLCLLLRPFEGRGRE